MSTMDNLLKGGTFSSELRFENTGSSNPHTHDPRQEPSPESQMTMGGEKTNQEKIIEQGCSPLITFVDDDPGEQDGESQHYTVVRKITDGRFAEVYEGFANEHVAEDGQKMKVAVKKLSKHEKYHCQHARREITALGRISNPNVVLLISTTEEPGFNVILLELAHTDLYVMQQNNVVFDIEEVRCITFMALNGLKGAHNVGIMHRDMKLSNLLLTNDGVIKICDFGLAREDDKENAPFTLQISTRWYKALEVLLGEKAYNRKIDIWAMGAILAELISGMVLFKGNCDIHVLFEIFKVMGSEHYQNTEWVERKTYPQYGNFIWSKSEPNDLSEVCGTKDVDFIDLVKKMLTYSVSARPCVDDCLAHTWLKSASSFCLTLQAKARVKYDSSSNTRILGKSS